MHRPPAVVVVGAGVVGASVAYHLARAGAPVTLIDRAAAPAAGATGQSFGWIGDRGGDWPGGEEVSVRLGALDGDPAIRPQYHSFVASRAPWDVLPDDGLPRHDAANPGADAGAPQA